MAPDHDIRIEHGHINMDVWATLFSLSPLKHRYHSNHIFMTTMQTVIL